MNHENVFNLLINAMLALFGGLARQLHLKGKKPVKVWELVSNGLIAAFAGSLGFFIMDYFNVHGSLSFAVAGLLGWLGPVVIDALGQVILTILTTWSAKFVKKFGVEQKKEGDE